MTLSGLARLGTAIKVHTLKYCMSCETLTIVDNLGLTESQKADEVQIIAALKLYVQGRKMKPLNAEISGSTDRHQVQTFDDYLVSLWN